MSQNKSVTISLNPELFDKIKSFAEDNEQDIETALENFILANQDYFKPNTSFSTFSDAFTGALEEKLKSKQISKERYDMLLNRLEKEKQNNT